MGRGRQEEASNGAHVELQKQKLLSTDCISMHDDTSAWVQAYITVDCSLGECMISPELDFLPFFFVCVYVCVWRGGGIYIRTDG